MNEEQFEKAITVLNLLWTIGVLSFDDAQRIVLECQNRYSIYCYNEIKAKSKGKS